MGVARAGLRKPLSTIAPSQRRRYYLIWTILFGLYMVTGVFMLSLNSLEGYIQLIFGGLCLVTASLLVYVRVNQGLVDRKLSVVLCLILLYIVLLFFIPEYLWGKTMDGIFHRSLLSAVVLILLSLPAFSSSLSYQLGGTPAAKQAAGYTWLALPVLIVVIVYAILIVQIILKGIPNLDWHILTSFFHYEGVTKFPGMANYILGTITLIVLTSFISLPVGIGTGLFISEYGGRLSGPFRLCTTALRSISVFILALGAYSVVKYSQGTIFHEIFNGFPNTQHGSFLVAAMFLSLLIIPVIARVTEEGCSSLPQILREGSIALGASEAFTLRRIILPWALPNVLTGLLLGCAEAAGSVGIILLIGGYGEFGFGPMGEVTSLALFIFKCRYGLISFTKIMSSYQFTAGFLLLMMTLILSAATLIMKRKFSSRYRGNTED